MKRLGILLGATTILAAWALMANKTHDAAQLHQQEGSAPYSKEIQAQIKQVENSLAGPVKFKGVSGDNILDRMAFYKVKGLSIAVVKDYQVIWAKGYGWADQGEKQPVTENTLFMAASISKSINSMGVMKLVQDGKLDLNKDINAYLTSWKFPYDEVSNGSTISTLNLLTHTSGVNNSAPCYSTQDTIPTLVQVLNGDAKPSRYVYSDPQAARSVIEPDVRYEYSNTGIGITQLMVSDITGKSYPEYMEETVFRPLGMTRSCYTEAALQAHAGEVATGYSHGYEVTGKHVIIPLQAAGGLWTTPTDLARFIVEVQLAYLGKSSKVLSQETVKTMLKPHFHAAPGFFLVERKIAGRKYFNHSGVIAGFRSEYFGSLEDGNGVAVMINSDAEQIIPEVVNSVATVYQWKDFYESKVIKKPTAKTPDPLLTRAEGVYMLGNEYAVLLKQRDGGHYWTEGQDHKMYFLNSKEFMNLGSPSTMVLVLDAAGEVTGITHKSNGAEVAGSVKVKQVETAGFSFGQLIDIGWYLLENQRPALAAPYFETSLLYDPMDLMSKCNLAHCYLFAGEYNKAIQIYGKHIDAPIDDMHTFKQSMLHDFVFFKENGFDTAPMDKVFADLKLGKPRAYGN